jgi:hypothetical protein
MRRLFAALVCLAAAPLALVALAGCDNKMDTKECDKLRSESFDLVNVAQHCDADKDCRPSEWPGCSKPLSNASFDKIQPSRDKFTKGKCEEPKIDCKESPPVYCKQGLCVHREKGMPEGAGDTPVDQIQVK